MAVGILRAVSTVVSSIAKKVGGKREKRSVDTQIAPSWGPYFSKGTSLIPFRGRRNRRRAERETRDEEDESERSGEEGEEEKESGVWQKAILMGEKCQPPEFSGAIFYDYEGRRLPTMPPKSPRSSLIKVK